MSRVVQKEKIEDEIQRTLQPFGGVFWQDLDSTQGLVKTLELFPAPAEKRDVIDAGLPTEQERISDDVIELRGLAPSAKGLVLPILKALRPATKTVVKTGKKGSLRLAKDVKRIRIKLAPKPQIRLTPTQVAEKLAELAEELSRIREKRTDEFIRVYEADAVDIFVVNLYARLIESIDLLTLSQPAHAPRRRKIVASRN